ncbi:histone chaperone RTT106-like [Lactuca sativa]|uniref:histone chaperone RTT106-like n=1 Tax=Lactuca sativa TaxID=4236 RepID=UPI000CD8CF5D|nr:histone chaperone RTT106-like [Lactuca sativa]
MGYEGVFPPTLKKRLPPYWRFLAHSFVICISGRKTSANEISLLNSGTNAPLIMHLEFKFSKFVLNEMKSHLQGKRKDNFLMYPRFLKMIFDSQYPDLERRGETLDLKSLGANKFGLMKQNRKGTKLVFQGKHPLEKFGQFAEINEASESESTSNDEDDDVTVSNHEEDGVPFVIIFAEEHVTMTNVDDNDDDDNDEGDDEMGQEDNVLDSDDDKDDDGAEVVQGDDLSGFHNNDFML